MSFSRLRSSTKASAPVMANGTANSTPSGRPQRSYSAARIRYTITSAKPKANTDALPVRFSWNAWPVHAMV